MDNFSFPSGFGTDLPSIDPAPDPALDSNPFGGGGGFDGAGSGGDF